MCAAKSVTVIPAKTDHITSVSAASSTMKRVAAYARVSTDNEEQLTSYEAQVDYYTRHILSNSSWQMVEVYSDEGISATSTKRRDGFNRMIADALNGEIDLIITKSVSRFARNTVDTLTTIRKLKDKGVEVYFEKENIFTLDSKGELFITIIASLSQEESRSIFENVAWGLRKRFADGKVSLPYGQFLGYEKGNDGLPKIIEKEANVVRLIYKLFLEGKTQTGIARYLTSEKIKSPGGKSKWSSSTITSILKNEKYMGMAILQKTYTIDFLTKKKKINEGEITKYYVENSHPAIIEPETYELVQEEFKRRKSAGKYTSAINCFASRIVCGDCGGFYGRKVWHSTTKYACTIWQCNKKFRKKEFCTTPHLKEEIIKNAFVEAFNSIIENRDKILQDYEIIISQITDTKFQEKEINKIEEESAKVETLVEKLVAENARSAISKEEYDSRYETYVAKYNGLQKRKQDLNTEIVLAKARHNQINAFINQLKRQEGLLTDFDEGLWSGTLNYVVVVSAQKLVFHFKEGTELEWELRDRKYE